MFVLIFSAGSAPLFLHRGTAKCATFFIFAPPHHRAIFSAKIFAPSHKCHGGTAPLNFSATAPHFRRKNSRHAKYLPLSRILKKIIAHNFFTKCTCL